MIDKFYAVFLIYFYFIQFHEFTCLFHSFDLLPLWFKSTSFVFFDRQHIIPLPFMITSITVLLHQIASIVTIISSKFNQLKNVGKRWSCSPFHPLFSFPARRILLHTLHLNDILVSLILISHWLPVLPSRQHTRASFPYTVHIDQDFSLTTFT